jgi:hypothetical protein
VKNLSARARNALASAAGLRWAEGRNWLPDPATVAKLTYVDVIRIPGCGRGTVKEIEDWLADQGLSLSETNGARDVACPCCGRPY